MRFIKHLVNEPLLQFFVLGVLLFFLVNYIKQRTDLQSREISVDNERVNLMILNYKNQTGMLPSKQQVDALIESYIKEEIAYREAKKMGLDKDDVIIRRRLSQKFDFLQTDLTETAIPTEEQLKKFYAENPGLFDKEETVSFSHIYFSADNSRDSLAKQRAQVVLNQLLQTTLQRAPEKGDRFPLQYDYTDQAVIDVQQNFGDKQILYKLFNAPLKTWMGPFQSGYGWHLIYVTSLDSARLIPFASIKDEVTTYYIEDEKSKQNKMIYDQLSKKYRIERAYLDAK